MPREPDGRPTTTRQLADSTANGQTIGRKASYHPIFFTPAISANEMKKMGLGTAVAALFACASMSAFAQTVEIDCTKPRQPVERMVCGNAALRALDARASVYYSLLLEAKPAAQTNAYHAFRDGLQTEQQKWQRDTRDACGAQAACLTQAYQRRIDALHDSALSHLELTVTAPAAATHNEPSAPSIDYKNAIYRVDDRDVTLLEGQHTQSAAADSAAQEITHIVEPPAHVAGKLGGRNAVAVFLSEQGGGSGTFYYVALAFDDGRGTTFKVGDRIQPVSIAINGDDLVVGYLDRNADEPMAVPPTVPRERHFAYMNGQILERPSAATAAK
jgi:uncharacterized protein